MESYILSIKDPAECSAKEIDDFEKMVLAGGEINVAGIRNRISDAELLAFYYCKEILVGVCAIKRPSGVYIKKVFNKAGVKELAGQCEYELGWAYVLPDCRHRKIITEIMTKLLEMRGNNIYATTRNKYMKNLLQKFNFKCVGN